jgi:uncharacterized membrane protein YdjX (TVP38/TMEM64 family)
MTSGMQEMLGQLQEWITGFGLLAPLIFITLFAVAMMLFMLSTPFFVMAGVLFGAVQGIGYILIGGMIAAVLSFLIARRFGAARFERFLRQHESRLLALEKRLLGRFGWMTIIVLRVLPLIPFPVMNYGLGLTRVRFDQYVVGTFFGILPAVVVYTAFGHAVFSFGLMDMLCVVGALAVFLFGISYLANQYDARSHS